MIHPAKSSFQPVTGFVTGGTTRREFLRQAAGAALGLWTAGCATRGVRPRKETYFDIHTHLIPSYGPLPAFTVDQLLRWMDDHNVERAAVLPAQSPEAYIVPLTTEAVLEQTRRHRDRLIPFCSLDPRTTDLAGKAATVQQLRRYAEAGARGVGEHKVGMPIDDRRNMIYFEACAEVGLPVLFHLDDKQNTDAPGLPGLEKVLSAFPGHPFIGHAQGWWASIDGAATAKDLGEYPERKVVPGGAVDALMERHPNLYGDLSANSGANALSRDPEFARAFVLRRADRLLFGTDLSSAEQEVKQFEVLGSLNLPEDVCARIYRTNAATLLKV